LAGLLLRHSASLERVQLEGRVLQVAEDLANDIDRGLDQHLTVLKTLATTPSLASGDWLAFYRRAKAALQGKAYVIVLDPSLRQLVNTRVPYGKFPSVTGDPETARRVLATKQPAVSDLFLSLVDKAPVFNVSIPILHDGEVRYILILGQHAADLLPILAGQRLGPEWTTAVIDRKGVVLARSREHHRHVGTAPASFTTDLAAADRTVRETTNLEGQATLRAAVRSQLAGWIITASIPLNIAVQPLRGSAWLWGGVVTLALLSAGVLAWLLARTLAQPMMAAAEAAHAWGRNEPVGPLNSPVAEANAIVAALQYAHGELAQRDNHQRLLLGELNHRVKNVLAVVQALIQRTLTEQRTMPEAREVLLERLHALSRAHDLLVRTDWQGADLKEIVVTELATLSDRASVKGPELTIDGSKVQTMAMVVHELSTNAIKHGSLSVATGTVSIDWSVTGTGPDARLLFRWKEKGGPDVKPSDRKGFGSVLLTTAFSSDVDPRLVFEPDGFLFELDVPLAAVSGSSSAIETNREREDRVTGSSIDKPAPAQVVGRQQGGTLKTA
jgi:two-component sensor histidine kinase